MAVPVPSNQNTLDDVCMSISTKARLPADGPKMPFPRSPSCQLVGAESNASPYQWVSHAPRVDQVEGDLTAAASDRIVAEPGGRRVAHVVLDPPCAVEQRRAQSALMGLTGGRVRNPSSRWESRAVLHETGDVEVISTNMVWVRLLRDDEIPSRYRSLNSP